MRIGTFQTMLVMCFAFIMASCFTSCSPEEKIIERIERETEKFKESDSDYLIQGTKIKLYNTSGNINYLADHRIRGLAISYADNLGRAEYCRNKANQHMTSTKLDRDFSPNWFEEAKKAEKEAHEHEEFANENKEELLHLMDSLTINNTGGIWAYHEITYKEYIYRYYAGPYVVRTLYLFSPDGERVLWSDKIGFYEDTFIKILNMTGTKYSTQSNYKSMRMICIVIAIALFLAFVVWSHNRNEAVREEEEKKKMLIREQMEKKREEAKLKAENDWKTLLEEREKEYGCITKRINITSDKANDIYVYEEGKVLFMLGNKYSFNDIISCTIEKCVHRKGSVTQTTTPDKYQMAEQQFLYGMGQKYNVKSTTHIEQTPDIYRYVVYIGLNSISIPQISFNIFNADVANEVKNLMNAIVSSRN